MTNTKRDPDRIPRILDRLKKVWESCPDLRLVQLIPSGGLYFVEDEDLIEAIEDMVKERKEVKNGFFYAPLIPQSPEIRKKLGLPPINPDSQ